MKYNNKILSTSFREDWAVWNKPSLSAAIFVFAAVIITVHTTLFSKDTLE